MTLSLMTHFRASREVVSTPISHTRKRRIREVKEFIPCHGDLQTQTQSPGCMWVPSVTLSKVMRRSAWLWLYCKIAYSGQLQEPRRCKLSRLCPSTTFGSLPCPLLTPTPSIPIKGFWWCPPPPLQPALIWASNLINQFPLKHSQWSPRLPRSTIS